MSTTTKQQYSALNAALKAMRENFMLGDLSGFESHEDLVVAIRAIEHQMFEVVRDTGSTRPSCKSHC